ncbi:MAG: vWA domain-containing protein, partial [Acidimicrobiales bacterium]
LSRPVSAAAPWQRLLPSALLVLQLLAVALLALAAARPVRATDVPLAQHTVFILDASGSMAATDGRPDRLADAKGRARALRAQVPVGGRASLVVASGQPRVLISSSADAGAFGEALNPVTTTAGPADFAAAFDLAESLEAPGEPIGFVLLSDGGLAAAEQRLIPPGTRYEKVGDRATNRAVTGLVVEPRGSGLHAIVTMRNTGGADAADVLRIDVDGRTEAEVRVRLPQGEVVEAVVDLPPGEQVEAALASADLLAADNRAFALAGRRPPLRVLVAGRPSLFLDGLLAATPGVTVERVADPRPAVGFDLAVYDRVAVPADPGAPFLAVAPPGGLAGLPVTGEVEQPAVVLVRAEDPLLASTCRAWPSPGPSG